MSMRAYSRFAWGVLAYNLGVIAWGAYVRATGSGAGCGQHWPTCQGDLVPRAPALETMVEYSHRLSSGLALVLTVALVAFAFRLFPKGHAVRRGAVLSAGFMALEALLGAALVLFGLVAKDASLARGLVMPVHLVNTFLLLASLTLTAWWASGGGDFRVRGQGPLGAVLGVGLIGVVALGITGAITALGDTLYPAQSLAHGMAQDLSPASHLFVRLRVAHPAIALLVGAYLLAAASYARAARKARPVRLFAGSLVALFAAQIVVGFVNMALLAPVAMQLTHLFVADLNWIALVLLTAAAFAAKAEQPERRVVPMPGVWSPAATPRLQPAEVGRARPPWRGRPLSGR
ncbi:MAG TPA: COX15/CtaA family protein [Myxococcales bacterium]|jgi:heme A synthase